MAPKAEEKIAAFIARRQIPAENQGVPDSFVLLVAGFI
jgi:hypothetical protein